MLVYKGLSVQLVSGPDCGTSLHRDHNAARNTWARSMERSALGQSVQAQRWAAGLDVA